MVPKSFEFTWAVDNFKERTSLNEILLSKKFYSYENNLCFRMELYKADNFKSKKEAAVVTVQSKSIRSHHGKMKSSTILSELATIAYTISRVKSEHDKEILFAGAYIHCFADKKPNNHGKEEWYEEEYEELENRKIHLSELRNCSQFDGDLVLHCEVKIDQSAFSSTPDVVPPAQLSSGQLFHAKKMKSVFENGTKSDITLLAGEKEFKVHKLHLSLHSDVFDAMFSYEETKEALEKKVVVEDVTAEVMYSLLSYIYTGNVEFKDKESTLQLLIAAEKYQIEGLKIECEDELSSKHLTPECVCSVLTYADLYNASTLKENCFQFIVKRSAEITSYGNAGWQQFVDAAKPELAKELLRRMGPNFK